MAELVWHRPAKTRSPERERRFESFWGRLRKERKIIMDLDEFEWLDEESEEYVVELQHFLPNDVLEHALILIEKMDADDGEIDYQYRRRIVRIMNEFYHGNGQSHCSADRKYTIFHEFCYYLEGWLWRIDYCSGTKEYDDLQLKPIK